MFVATTAGVWQTLLNVLFVQRARCISRVALPVGGVVVRQDERALVTPCTVVLGGRIDSVTTARRPLSGGGRFAAVGAHQTVVS
jgi:hypothetical protein